MSRLKNELLEALKEPALPDDDLRRRLLEVLLESARPRKMTYEEFLAWADEDTLAEWVDGEVIMLTLASRRHQNVADFLLRVIGAFVEMQGLGMVISAPFHRKERRYTSFA
jgi:Uma2 family endonuclease